MGNYCSEADENSTKKIPSPKKRLSSISTKSNDGNVLDYQKLDGIEIVEILNVNYRVSTRPDFPRITHVEVVEELGNGAQAHVFKVNIQTKDPKQRYSLNNNKATLAIKRINIKQQKKNQKSIQLATQLLLQNNCPFLMTGFFFFKDKNYLYEGMKYAEGGDLTSFMERTKGKGDAFRKLGQLGIKLVFAGIILGLEYLHGKGLIYCDLKPDNILIGQDGYPMLADFQLAKSQKSIPTTLFEGTITSVGPQIYGKDTFDKSMDLWALGTLIYTLAYNQPPYTAQDILECSFCEECKQRQNKYKLKRKKISQQLSDLINKLLRYQPHSRIGYYSINEIKKHPFFNNFQWSLYEKKQLPNPISQIIKQFNLDRLNLSATYN